MLKNFIVKCEKLLNIQKPEDWYNISQEQVKKLGGMMIKTTTTTTYYIYIHKNDSQATKNNFRVIFI